MILDVLFGDLYFSFQKQILFTIIYTLSKPEQQINVSTGTSNPAILRLQSV